MPQRRRDLNECHGIVAEEKATNGSIETHYSHETKMSTLTGSCSGNYVAVRFLSLHFCLFQQYLVRGEFDEAALHDCVLFFYEI